MIIYCWFLSLRAFTVSFTIFSLHISTQSSKHQITCITVNMRLRKNIRTPIRFEDEAVTYNVPKKKQLQMPAFPEEMAKQVIPFNKHATSATFPSLPFTGPAPRLPATTEETSQTGPAKDETIHEAESQLEMSDEDDTDEQALTCIGNEETVTWSSLELAVQHAIWTNMCRQMSRDDAADLLQLFAEEVQNIRIAVAKRRQSPIDSSWLLANLDAEDPDGSLSAQFTPFILTAQSYELALPIEIERGRRLLRNLELLDCYIGVWCPEPDQYGSSYLKCMLGPQGNVAGQIPADTGSGYPSFSEYGHPPTASVTENATQILDSGLLEHNNTSHTSESERRARPAKIRLLQPSEIPQKQLSDTSQTASILNDGPQASKSHPATDPGLRTVVIKNGIDPQEHSPSTITVAAPSLRRKTQVPDKATQTSPGLLPANQFASRDTPPTSETETPARRRSSGSMSLRSRDRLRSTPAMAAMKQNAEFWEGELDDYSVSESDDDRPQTPPQKRISLKINDKSALASIFQGDKKITPNYPAYQSIAIKNGHHNLGSENYGSNSAIPKPDLSDEPSSFANYFTHPNFPQVERQRLLSKPIRQRNTVEMWLIYGTNAWKFGSRWNVALLTPFHQPAKLNLDEAGSSLAKILVDEWNRAQDYGYGMNILERTTIGGILLNFNENIEQLQRDRDRLVQDEQVLVETGFPLDRKNRWDHQQNYHREVQICLRKVEHDLSQVYAEESYGGALPVRKFRTPSIVRESYQETDGDQWIKQNKRSAVSAIQTTPEQTARATSSNEFAMKLIELPSSESKRPSTPSGDNLGIFGRDEDDRPMVLQGEQQKAKNAEPLSNGGSYEGQDSTIRGAIAVLNGYQKITKDIYQPIDAETIAIKNDTAATEDIAMTEPPAITNGDATEQAVSNIPSTPPQQNKRSPRRPSWSPISDNEEFHSAPGSPVLSPGEAVYTPGRLKLLLQGAVSELPSSTDRQPEEEPGILPSKDASVEQPLMQESERVPEEESLIASIETDVAGRHDMKVGKTAKPRIKLTLRQPPMMDSNPPASPKTKISAEGKEKKDKISSVSAGIDAAPIPEVEARVTRSMTATPVPGDTGGAATANKKRKVTPKSSLKPKTTKKGAAAKTPVHAQIETLKHEDGIETPTSNGGTKATATPKSSGQKTKAMGTPSTPTTRRGPRGPYKKTRERMGKLQAEKEALDKRGENGIANKGDEGGMEDVQMTG